MKLKSVSCAEYSASALFLSLTPYKAIFSPTHVLTHMATSNLRERRETDTGGATIRERVLSENAGGGDRNFPVLNQDHKTISQLFKISFT